MVLHFLSLNNILHVCITRITGKHIFLRVFCVKNTSCQKILSKISIKSLNYVLYVTVTYKIIILMITFYIIFIISNNNGYNYLLLI